jgi:hypothetical protein
MKNTNVIMPNYHVLEWEKELSFTEDPIRTFTGTPPRSETNYPKLQELTTFLEEVTKELNKLLKKP